MLSFESRYNIKITTQDNFADENISQTLGLLMANSVQCCTISRSIMGSIRSMFGGEVNEFTSLLTETRDKALKNLIHDAKSMKADGIVGIRFNTSSIDSNTTEVLVFGTAVKFQD